MSTGPSSVLENSQGWSWFWCLQLDPAPPDLHWSAARSWKQQAANRNIQKLSMKMLLKDVPKLRRFVATSQNVFTFLFHIPGTVEQEDGSTPTCVLLHICLIYVSFLHAGAFKRPRLLDWLIQSDTTMLQKRCVGAAAAVFLLAFVSHSEAIIGGREATPHSRPYMASIQVPEGESLKHECGGFVVADQWVMTAVHCLPTGPNGRKVVLGLHSLSQPEDTKQIFDILDLHNHPDYNPLNYDNDIALVKLDRPFNATEAVRSVEFLRAGGTNPGTNAAVETAGWGSVDNLGARPDKLKEVVLEVVSSARCKRSDYFGRKFTTNMLCAHKVCEDPCDKPFRKEDSCDGDSGGPLLYNGVAVGITSNGGKKCGQLKKPGIYTIISHYTEWIEQILAEDPAPTEDPSS